MYINLEKILSYCVMPLLFSQFRNLNRKLNTLYEPYTFSVTLTVLQLLDDKHKNLS